MSDSEVDELYKAEAAPKGLEWLHAAIKKEQDPKARAALYEKEEKYLNDCVHAAVTDDYNATVKLLQEPDGIERVINMQHPFWGGNLLHMAASNGCQRSIFALLAAKFDPEAKDDYFGNSALENARRSNNPTTLAILEGRLKVMPEKTWEQELEAGREEN